ncbi:CobW family GTP-binding protein [Salisediminibacterium beveridgei]|nr:GTP-binding protein [Salisediminibacterium beveridgei]
MGKVDVVVLSGFLGAGKTTLLEQLLERERQDNRKVAVVMNEVGEVSIDSDAVPNGTPLRELLNGCVCCTLSDKLEIKLNELIYEHELDVIYIETSGVAHPVDVLETCLTPLLAEKVRIRSLVAMLDALTWSERHTFSIPVRQLISEQVKHADVVVLNKLDAVSDETKQAIEAEVRSLNTQGKVIPTTFARVDANALLHSERQGGRDHVNLHQHEHLHIKTFVHTFSKPVNKEVFEGFLREMPDTIYRIKGYIRFEEGETLLFQYSYGMANYEKADLKYKNTLVLIGDNLDHEALGQRLSEMEER